MHCRVGGRVSAHICAWLNQVVPLELSGDSGRYATRAFTIWLDFLRVQTLVCCSPNELLVFMAVTWLARFVLGPQMPRTQESVYCFAQLLRGTR